MESTSSREEHAPEEAEALLTADPESLKIFQLNRKPTDRQHGDKAERPAMQAQQAKMVGIWLGLLTMAWILAKSYCIAGLPSDCVPGFWTAGAMEDLQHLALYGVVLAWMTGLLDEGRFQLVFQVSETTRRSSSAAPLQTPLPPPPLCLASALDPS